MTNYYFDHEKLKVYQKAIEFVSWLTELLANIQIKNDIISQLNRASNSIVLNIAEGNGRFTSKDRCHFFDIAKGSSLECAGGLDILVARQIIDRDKIIKGKKLPVSIISMLIGLIKSNSDRVYSPEVEYNVDKNS